MAPERAAAREAITQLRLTPVLFESGARPYPPRELYRAYLAQSDVFVGLYWQRYGWVAPDMKISGLEDEYQLVILPMVLQIPNTIVLQKVELGGKASSIHFGFSCREQP